MRRAVKNEESWRLEERRKEARYTLILRAGLLEQQGKSAFCLVKNISRTGVQVKFYVEPLINTDVVLRVADEPAVKGRLMWIKGAVAGISFDEELDTATFLRVQQKLRPNRRRAIPRMLVSASVSLRTRGRAFKGTACDVSSFGARVKTEVRMLVGDRMVIQFPDLPPIDAFVRWAEGEEAGLAFQTPVPLQVIADWIAGQMRAP